MANFQDILITMMQISAFYRFQIFHCNLHSNTMCQTLYNLVLLHATKHFVYFSLKSSDQESTQRMFAKQRCSNVMHKTKHSIAFYLPLVDKSFTIC